MASSEASQELKSTSLANTYMLRKWELKMAYKSEMRNKISSDLSSNGFLDSSLLFIYKSSCTFISIKHVSLCLRCWATQRDGGTAFNLKWVTLIKADIVAVRDSIVA